MEGWEFADYAAEERYSLTINSPEGETTQCTKQGYECRPKSKCSQHFFSSVPK